MAKKQIKDGQDVEEKVLQIIRDITGQPLEKSQLEATFLDSGITCGASAQISDQLNEIYPGSRIDITCWEDSPQGVIGQIRAKKKA